jgi:hypothetical protein
MSYVKSNINCNEINIKILYKPIATYIKIRIIWHDVSRTLMLMRYLYVSNLLARTEIELLTALELLRTNQLARFILVD